MRLPTTLLGRLRAAPPRLLAPSHEWQGPCRLEETLLRQAVLSYDPAEYDFVGAAHEIFGHEHPLGSLHRAPVEPWDATPPALRRGQIQARVGAAVSKQERKGARRRAWDFERSESWKRFLEVYRRFVVHWVAPTLGGVPLLYQRKPILRVVLPGSVAPTQMHCDADYYHDSNELNLWVPLSDVAGASSLWSESAPGRGDYAAFEAGPGQAVRFYGNRCRHFTTPNDTERTRVSFDFRVIPQHLFVPPPEHIARVSKHSLNPGDSKRGYYAVAYPPGSAEEAVVAASGEWAPQRSVTLGAQRRAWREGIVTEKGQG